MRPDTKQRRQPRPAGPALIRKDPLCGHKINYSRADPFGVQDYSVDYSMNKKARWAINEEIADRIEDVQEPDSKIRVSASMHGKRRGKATIEELHEPRNHLPCLEYHSVYGDGESVHKHSASCRTQLRSLTVPANPPKAKGKARRAAQNEQQHDDQPDATENHLHIHYTIREASAAAPKSNKANSKSTTNRGNSMQVASEFEHPIEFIDDYDAFACDDVETLTRPFVEDLITLLVFKNDTRKKKAANVQRARFVDEPLKAAFVPSHVRNDVDFVGNNDGIAPTLSLTPPTEMLTRLGVSSLPLLHSAPRLSCHPATWEIHQKDCLRLLGMDLPHCVIARQCGDDLRLGIVEDCPSTHPSRLQLPSMEDDIPLTVDFIGSQFCQICCGEMDFVEEDRLNHPFGLSCAHLFCTGCWLSHISQSISLQALPTPCLHPECTATVSFSAAKGLLSSHSYALYERSTIAALKAAQKTVQCLECTRFLRVSGGRHISCPCGASLCFLCHSIYHSPLSCEAFRQFDKFMRGHGFAPVYSAVSDTPRISALTKCPKCSILMQRSAGCNMMTCLCGTMFCYNCGQAGNYGFRHECKKQLLEVTMLDVITRNVPLLVASQLPRAIEARIELIDRRKMLRQQLLGLPSHEKRVLERVFVQLSLLVELCGLGVGSELKARRSLAKRVRSALDIFLNLTTKDASSRGRALKEFHDQLLH